MSRVEHIFGPRESWGKGNEQERVEAGKQGDAPSDPLARAISPVNGGDKGKRIVTASVEPHNDEKDQNAADSGSMPAGELKKAGFVKDSEPEGVKGFVSIRCGGCGKIMNTCLHEKRTIFNCKACGHPNKLESLKTMKVECPRCSFRGLYKTNREESPIVMECLNCSHPVQLRKGNRRGNYVTIKEERQ